jgi:hypothetical protein
VLHGEKTALRITDLAGRLSIDAPPAERCEFARLIGHFTGDIDRSLDELNL